MWALHLLPEWLIHTTFVVSILAAVVGFLLQDLPLIAQYRLPVQVVSTVLVVASVFLEGGMAEKAAWQARVLEMQAAAAQAEADAAKTNTKIVTQVITKVQYVKDTTNANKQAVANVGQALDSSCSLTSGAVVLHDSASQNQVSRSPTTADGSPSNVKASQLLTTVVDNYGTCYEMREKLLAWQQWYREQKQIFESVK